MSWQPRQAGPRHYLRMKSGYRKAGVTGLRDLAGGFNFTDTIPWESRAGRMRSCRQKVHPWGWGAHLREAPWASLAVSGTLFSTRVVWAHSQPHITLSLDVADAIARDWGFVHSRRSRALPWPGPMCLPSFLFPCPLLSLLFWIRISRSEILRVTQFLLPQGKVSAQRHTYG